MKKISSQWTEIVERLVKQMAHRLQYHDRLDVRQDILILLLRRHREREIHPRMLRKIVRDEMNSWFRKIINQRLPIDHSLRQIPHNPYRTLCSDLETIAPPSATEPPLLDLFDGLDPPQRRLVELILNDCEKAEIVQTLQISQQEIKTLLEGLKKYFPEFF